jgi:hypothetical protein
MPPNALAHLIYQFVLVILLGKVYTSYFVMKEKCHVTQGGGVGGGSEKCYQMSPGGGGPKNCGKIVTYYLNGH